MKDMYPVVDSCGIFRQIFLLARENDNTISPINNGVNAQL